MFCFDQTLCLLPDILKSVICSVSNREVDKMSDGQNRRFWSWMTNLPFAKP